MTKAELTELAKSGISTKALLRKCEEIGVVVRHFRTHGKCGSTAKQFSRNEISPAYAQGVKGRYFIACSKEVGEIVISLDRTEHLVLINQLKRRHEDSRGRKFDTHWLATVSLDQLE